DGACPAVLRRQSWRGMLKRLKVLLYVGASTLLGSAIYFRIRAEEEWQASGYASTLPAVVRFQSQAPSTTEGALPELPAPGSPPRPPRGAGCSVCALGRDGAALLFISTRLDGLGAQVINSRQHRDGPWRLRRGSPSRRRPAEVARRRRRGRKSERDVDMFVGKGKNTQTQ
ncbi:unnamed protein product, partial [Prorocentrum cordatum]